jgi:hypothetical protein
MFLYQVKSDGTLPQVSGDTLNGGAGSDQLVGNSGQELLFGFDPAEDTFVDSSGSAFEDGRRPVISDIPDQTIEEGRTLSLDVTADDPDGDPVTWRFEAIDGEAFPTGIEIEPISDNLARLTFTPGDEANYAVRLIATDPMDISGSAEFRIIAINADPEPEITGNLNPGEGDTVQLSGIANDSVPEDTHTFAWVITDPAGMTIETSDQTTVEFFVADDGLYEATLTVTDNDGGIGSTSVDVNAGIVAPQFSLGDSATLTEADQGWFTRGGISISDPVEQTFIGTVDYGDGGGEQPLTIDPVSNTFALNHRFNEAGTFTITVRIDDGDGGVSTRTMQVEAPEIAHDEVPPESHIEPLPQVADSLFIPLNITASDAGNPASGIATIEIEVSVDQSAFQPWTEISGQTTAIVFPAESGSRYSFRSRAKDNAGNVETSDGVDATIYVPDFDAPVTNVDQVDISQPVFQIVVQGSDSGGSRLRWIDVYVEVDNNNATLIKSVDVDSETYDGSIAFTAIADGQEHTYRFYSIGRDGRGNAENPPTDTSRDAVVTATFAAPQELQFTDFDVQNGLTQRSFIRDIDAIFNSEDGLDEILLSLDDGDVSNDLIRLQRFELDGSGSGDSVPLSGKVERDGSNLSIDLGSQGLTTDGYYHLWVDLNGDQAIQADETKNFYRIYGDTTGDRQLDMLDLQLLSVAIGLGDPERDVNGDGAVDFLDLQSVYMVLIQNQFQPIKLIGGLDLDD